VVERKQTMPILSCVLINAHDDHLIVTATDLEIELITYCAAVVTSPGSAAIPARKLFDICRGLADGTEINVDFHEDRVRARSGRARFMLTYMNADNWQKIQDFKSEFRYEIEEITLNKLLNKTEFAMAHQDVRYYLNGLFFILRSDRIRCVATDGHRLALSESATDIQLAEPIQAIVPRKAIMELTKLLDPNSDSTI